MKKAITMPRLKPDMQSGILCAWSAEPGERVAAGAVLFEVETDKVVTAVEAEENCMVVTLLVEEGDEVAPGVPVCEVETKD